MLRWSVRIGLALLLLVAVAIALLVGLTWTPDRPVDSLKARWAKPPSQFVSLQGLNVHLRDVGPRDDPMPIVLVHGTSASLHTWEPWVEALQATRRVVTMDLPGFGLTGPRADNDYRIETYVSFIASLLDTLKLPPVVLAGNSLGGEIAWNTAVAHQSRIAKLVLIDSAGFPLNPKSVPIGFQIARTPVLNQLMTFTLPRALVESSVKDVYGDPTKVTLTLIDRYYELALRQGNRAALGHRFRAMASASERADPAPKLRGLKTPTLILWGGQDRLIPPENARQFAAAIAGSQLRVFEALGHVPHEEDGPATVAEVLRFLK